MVLLKWLILGLAIWLFYRLYLAPRALGGGEQSRMEKPAQPEEGEYVDYEEVD
jgi:hypothetical protein